MFKTLLKVVFLSKATIEVGRERIEDYLDLFTIKADECRSQSNDCLNETKEKFKQVATDISQQIWHRSEILESQVKDSIRRQVADFSLGALGDSSEINELRAEIATLRAELSDLKASKVSV